MTDPAQARMDDLAADRYEAVIAAALLADGFDPPPAVGEVWEHPHCGFLPDGQRRCVRITSIGKTVSGWQCRVEAWHETTTGEVTWRSDLGGVLYVKTLVAEYKLMEGRQ